MPTNSAFSAPPDTI
jgi:hypothetical protein